MADRTRYRMRLTVPALPGVFGTVLKLFPNALTFVGYPTPDQLALVVSANGVLGAFGVSIEVTASN